MGTPAAVTTNDSVLTQKLSDRVDWLTGCFHAKENIGTYCLSRSKTSRSLVDTLWNDRPT